VAGGRGKSEGIGWWCCGSESGEGCNEGEVVEEEASDGRLGRIRSYLGEVVGPGDTTPRALVGDGTGI
jgi:hypothetical protein